MLEHGEVVLRGQLDYEQRDRYAFHVTASDGRQNATTLVQIVVLNVNDWGPRFRHAQYEFYVTEPPRGSPIGQVQVFDGDRGDRVELELAGPDARAFAISPAGVISLKGEAEGVGAVAHFVVTAEDSGTPPRHAAVPVIVHFSPQGNAALKSGRLSFCFLTLFRALSS